jgi:hypothetical protein
MLNTGHAYGSITDTMKIIKIEKKGKYLNALEKTSKNGWHMNDAYINVCNPIFGAIQE